MSIITDIKALLESIVPLAFPDVAPVATERPYAVYQQVGGESISFLEAGVPSIKNGRFQIRVWADTRLEASDLALQIESAFMLTTVMQAEPLGSSVDEYEDELDPPRYGTRQDFSVWSDR